ncbi:hypothetical protein NVS55_38220 [Myxococcus stipitatus]|uniref:hypothetical protein n=1 Tax=Myxococcus stipitatus TaxID=83455 RepID=UPI0031450A86
MPMSSVVRGVVALVALLSMSGCSVTVGRTPSRPNIDLAQQASSLGLVLEPEVQDQFSVVINAPETVHVKEWRGTLEDGFRAGFASAFPMGAAETDLKVQLAEAELTYAPTAVGRHGVVSAIEAQIRYKARLMDARGQVLKRSTGTVSSKRSATSGREVSGVTVSAVESLYEQLSRDFFTEAPPAPVAAPTP